MDITCSAEPCPIVLNATCVFYEGDNLIYTGINNNDNLQTALQKIDQKFQDAGLGYIFSNGIEQLVPGGAVMLGGALNKNTTIGGLYNLAFAGTLEASALITTGGSSTDFVKGDGSLDSTNYQPAGNYISNLTGDVIANGPGSVAATLATVFGAPGTYGNAGNVPSITVDGKGRITNVTPTPINYPAQSLSFVGDVEGLGFTGSPVTLTLDTVNSNVYGSNTFLKFAVNGKGLITSATPVSGGDITTALGYVPVPTSRTLSINGVTHDLTTNRSWNVGTVTSVGVSAGTGISASIINPNTNPVINIVNTAPDQTVNLNAGFGISISGSYPNFTITNDYPDIPPNVTSFSAGNLSPLFTTSVTNPTSTPALSFALSSAAANTVLAGPNGGAGAPTYRALVAADIPSLSYISNISTVAPLATTGGLTPTLSISQASSTSNGYLTSTDWNTFNDKQPAGSYITALTGEATALGPGSASVTLSTSAVTAKLLTGLNLTGGGSIAATDSILQAFGKVQNQISALVGGVMYQGVWNASTNTPTLTSSVGTKGYYYIVDVAGSTNLNGITDWKVGDWAIFNGSTWDKVDNTDAVSSVNGFTGAVNLTTANISEVTNLYYTDTRARGAISLTTTGTSGAATYDNTTGVFNIPQYQSVLTNPITGTGTSGQVAYFNGTNSITSNAAFAFTPTSQLLVNNSVTAASAIARGTNLTPTLTAAANNDVLVGLDINPTFTNGAFTGVTNTALRITGASQFLGTISATATIDGFYTQTFTNSSTGTSSVVRFLMQGSDGGGAGLSIEKVGSNYVGTGARSAGRAAFIAGTNGISLAASQTNGDIRFYIGDVIAGAEKMRLSPINGNLLINTTTDAGFRLDVNGTARIQSFATINAAPAANAESALLVQPTTNNSASSAGLYGIYNNATVNTIASTSSFTGIYSRNSIGATLVQASGVQGDVNISAGTTTTAIGFTCNSAVTGTGTASTFIGYNFTDVFKSGSGAVARQIGVRIQSLSAGSAANVGLLFNNAGNTSVSGTWDIYSQSGNASYILGDVTLGTTTLGTATKLTVGGSETASSAIARGQLLNTTLVAAANNDVLVGLDINPTFTNGSFTSVTNAALRVGPVSNAYISSLNQSRFGFTTDALTFGSNGFNISTNAAGSIQRPNNASRMVLGTANIAGLQPGYLFALDSFQKDKGLIFDRDNSWIALVNGTASDNSTTYTPRLYVFENGNVTINTATNAGFRLDVNGTARVTGNTVLGGSNDEGYRVKIENSSASVLRLLRTGLLGANFTFNSSNALTISGCSVDIASGLTVGINTSAFVPSGGFLYVANGVTIGQGSTINASAVLDVASTTKGFLPPRMTQVQRDAIATPAAGLKIYNTTNNTQDYYNGTSWISLQAALTNPVTGTGTTNYLPKFTGTSTIGNSATQTDSTGNLMVGSANSGNAGTINVSVGAAGTTAGGLQLWAASNQTHFIQFGDGTTGAQVYAGYMAYAHSTDSLLFGTNGADKMFLNSSGNLGLGTSSPSYKLEVYDSSTDAVALFNSGSANGGHIRFAASGNVKSFIGSAAGFITSGGVDDLGLRAVGSIRFATNGAGTDMLLDASGNLGLGVTPSAWGSNSFAFQTQGGAVWSFSSAYMDIWQNSYYNGASSIYQTTAAASFYRQTSGSHEWNTAPSGTAGTAISWTQAMTLNASGNLSIGNTNDTYKLDVSGTGRFTSNLYTSTALYINTTAAYGFRINSEGNNGFYNRGGSTTAHYPFLLENSSGSLLFQIQGNGAATFSSSVTAGGDFIFNAASRSIVFNSTNTLLWENSGSLNLRTGGSDRLTIASTGAATFTAATQDAIQTVVRMSGNNASNQLKALDFKLTAGTPLWTISTAATGTDAGINIMPNGSAGLSLTYTGAATFSSSVGIGTAATARQLQVTSTSDGNYATGIAHNGSTSNSFGLLVQAGTNSSDAALRIMNKGGTNDYLYVRGDGNVGIGTTSPSSILHTSSSNGTVRFSSSTGNDAGRIVLMEAGLDAWSIDGDKANGQFAIRDEYNSSTRFVIGNTGNVGIGTTSPSGKFEIASTANTYASAPAITFTDTSGDASSNRWIVGNIATTYGTFNIASAPTPSSTTYTPRLSILSNGNVGIGTTSPSAKFEVWGQTNIINGAINFGGTGSAISTDPAIYRVAGNSFVFANNGSEAMRITSGGNVGIGTSSPFSNYRATFTNTSVGTDRSTIYLQGAYSGTNPTAGIDFGSTNGIAVAAIRQVMTNTGNGESNIAFHTWNGSSLLERMTITSGGHIKATSDGSYTYSSNPFYSFENASADWTAAFLSKSAASPNGILIAYNTSPNNSGNWLLYGTDSSAQRFGFRSNGGLANYQANDTNLSDIRTKKDITPLESYWDKFKAIEMVKFKYKDQTHDDFNIGVIAQQVEKVAPEFIDVDGWGETPKDGVPLKSIYTSDLHHATIKVLQEAMAKIEDLQNQLDTLKNK